MICDYYNANNMEISFFPANWKPCHRTSAKKHHQLAKFGVEVNKKNPNSDWLNGSGKVFQRWKYIVFLLAFNKVRIYKGKGSY